MSQYVNTTKAVAPHEGNAKVFHTTLGVLHVFQANDIIADDHTLGILDFTSAFQGR